MRDVFMLAGLLARAALSDNKRVQTLDLAVVSHWLYPDARMTIEEFAHLLARGVRATVMLGDGEAHGLWTYSLDMRSGRATFILSGALFEALTEVE